jgi:F0F1-type ATP synthase membrane subunit c/vacuolar-type H+-ATPase subunit K
MIDDKAAAGKLFTIRILFFAMIAAMAVYLAAGWIIVSAATEPPPETPVFIKYVLAAVGLFTAAGSHLMSGILRGPARIKALAANAASGPGRESDGQDVRPEVVALLNSTTIVGLALCESAAIFGLVIAIVFHDLNFLLGLTALAALAMLPHYPSASRLQALNQAFTDHLMMDGYGRG